MDDGNESNALPIGANPWAPLIYADCSTDGGVMMGDNLTVTFVAKVTKHIQSEPIAEFRPVLHLVMPRDSLAAAGEFMCRLAKNFAMEGEGEISSPPTLQ